MIDQSKLNLKDRRKERITVNQAYCGAAPDPKRKLLSVGQECVMASPVIKGDRNAQFGVIVNVNEWCYTVDVDSPFYLFCAAHADVYTPEDWASLVLTL